MARSIHRYWAPFLGAFLALSAAATAWAGEATDVVRAKQSTLFGLLKQPDTAANKVRVKALFDEMLVYDALAEASLGSQWGERSADEKKRFQELLEKLVRRNYERNLRNTLGYAISYEGEVTQGEELLVKTVAKSKTDEREPPLEIDFLMKKIENKWQVVDIFTEKASLVRSYRTQFVKLIKKKGFETLIEKMEDKLAKGES